MHGGRSHSSDTSLAQIPVNLTLNVLISAFTVVSGIVEGWPLRDHGLLSDPAILREALNWALVGVSCCAIGVNCKNLVVILAKLAALSPCTTPYMVITALFRPNTPIAVVIPTDRQVAGGAFISSQAHVTQRSPHKTSIQ